MTLQTLPEEKEERSLERVGQQAGFSLHAGVSVEAHERDKLEQLCRYLARPALCEPRLSQAHGKILYKLKTPYRDGSTHVVFNWAASRPLDFISKLAALVPQPRVNLTRYHGVLSPNSGHRGDVTPAGRGKRRFGTSKSRSRGQVQQRTARSDNETAQSAPPKNKSTRLNWAKRLHRAFGINAERCDQCGGNIKIIATIQDPRVIDKILTHLKNKVAREQETCDVNVTQGGRGPPSAEVCSIAHQTSLFD